MTDPTHPDDIDADLLGLLVDAAGGPVPSTALKDRLMRSVDSESRLGARFTARLAAIIDVADAQAQALLDAIDDVARWVEGPLEGLSLFHIEGGPKVARAVCGFTRMQAGSQFPEHTHVGEETVLVLQGGFTDSSGAVHRAGDVVIMGAGTTHAFTVAPGPDLVYLNVVQDGFKIGDFHFTPDDPTA